jgi:ABC-2 type transport system permease protein
VNNSFLLFFPFAFLTTAYLPQEALTGWLATAADFNPTTYILAGMREIVLEGWGARPILEGLGATALVGAVSFSLAFAALRGRVRSA